jgi:hypothetical protein
VNKLFELGKSLPPARGHLNMSSAKGGNSDESGPFKSDSHVKFMYSMVTMTFDGLIRSSSPRTWVCYTILRFLREVQVSWWAPHSYLVRRTLRRGPLGPVRNVSLNPHAQRTWIPHDRYHGATSDRQFQRSLLNIQAKLFSAERSSPTGRHLRTSWSSFRKTSWY